MTTSKRNYRKEYREYHGKPTQIAEEPSTCKVRAKSGGQKGMRPQEPYLQGWKQSPGPYRGPRTAQRAQSGDDRYFFLATLYH